MGIERDIDNTLLRVKYLEEDRERLAKAVEALVEAINIHSPADWTAVHAQLSAATKLVAETRADRYDYDCYKI